MPKSRASNTVASTGSGGGINAGSIGIGSGAGGGIGGIGGGSGGGEEQQGNIENQELIQRIQDRLQGAREITVTVPSRTRRRDEEAQVSFDQVRNGIATVSSASGNSYDVDFNNGTCTCMHYRIHGDGCRHIDATNIAMGRILDGRGGVGSVGQGLNGTNADVAINGQQQLDMENEEMRNAISVDQEDDEYFYSDNYDEFANAMDSGIETEYEYHNVLNGSNITFGIELEFVGGNADAIASELYSLGISAYDSRVGYHSRSVPGKWKLERDGSVSSGSGGGELVSPVLTDTPETWRNIETICEVAKRHGARVNYQTGAHVHIGMEPLDTARQRWKRFFKIIGGFEESIYRFSGGDLGRIRSGYDHYSMPFAEIAATAARSRFRMDTEDDVTDLASRVGRSRYYGINLTNIASSGRPNTVEFRYFNGSLSAKQIQANIKLANGVIMAAEKARTQQGTESMKRRGEMINDFSSNNRDRNSIMKFIDIICTRKKDKDALIQTFRANDWR